MWSSVQTTSNAACQDRYGVLPVPRFNLRACTMCYEFLFKREKELLALQPTLEYLMSRNATHGTVWKPIAPDIQNETVAEVICSTLDHRECARWRACCTSAFKCCARQQRTIKTTKRVEGQCEQTWDGYSCWDDTSAGQTVSVTCPSYIGQYITDREYPGCLLQWFPLDLCLLC